MGEFLKLLYIEMFGKTDPKLNGVNIFSPDYSMSSQYATIFKLFGKSETPFVRIPIQSNSIELFLKASRLAYSNGIEVVALLDSYENHNSIITRLNIIKSKASYVKYFEIFNELPHMNDLYPGEKIQSLKELLDKTNQYSDWIHKNISNSKVITMAPYNSMDERTWGVWDNVSNTRILKELILYTVADISAIHLYGDSLSKKLQLISLADNIKVWNEEANYKKRFWITECGVDSWKEHINYYDKIIKLMTNTINPDKIFWYRQCTQKATDKDSEFALETLDNLQISPLYKKLFS